MTDGKRQASFNLECEDTQNSLWCESVKEYCEQINQEQSELQEEEKKENCKFPYSRESRSLSLSEGYAHLYLFQLPYQLTATIMSGLSWINQLDPATILQNIANNALFKKRNSTPITESVKNDGNNSSFNSNTLQSKALAKLLNDKTIRTLKSSELIELDSFGLVELDNSEAGIGHEFESYKNDKPTWCDTCADYLSTPVMDGESDKNSDNVQSDSESSIGSCPTSTPVAVQTDHLMRIYIQCSKCKYVCHLKCLPMIRIDCRPAILIDEIDPSTRLRTRKSKPKNNRHRNSVRFDGQLFPNNSNVSTPQVEAAIEETADIDSNNNCNNEQDDQQTSSDVSVSESIDPTNSSIILNDDESPICTSFDESSTYDPDSSESTVPFSSSSSSYQKTPSSVETLSECVFQSDNDNATSENSINNSDSGNKQCSTYSATELLLPSLIINLKYKILKYNERIRSKGSGLGITLIDESRQLFRGFLKVQMNLTRPINVVAGKRPPSIYDIINEHEENAQQNQQRRTLTSFYMPRDTVKNIHITSENTTLHVIKEMLKKFKVVDNPQKFALYLRRRCPNEETSNNFNDELRNDQNYEKSICEFINSNASKNCLKRLHDVEKPLILQLEFGSYAPDCVDIVLQENDNADICWDAFEIPELKNFLNILDREEAEHLSHVRDHYMDKKRLICAMIEREEAKLSAVNISHPNSPERFNGNGPPDNDENGNNSTLVIIN